MKKKFKKLEQNLINKFKAYRNSSKIWGNYAKALSILRENLQNLYIKVRNKSGKHKAFLKIFIQHLTQFEKRLKNKICRNYKVYFFFSQ